MTVSEMRPSDKRQPTGRQSTKTLSSQTRSQLRSRPVQCHRQVKSPPGYSLPRCAPRSWPRSLSRRRTAQYTKSTKILLKPLFESAVMESTGWSPKQTSLDDNHVKQHLEVNSTYWWIPIERYSTKYYINAQESAGKLEFGMYNHLFW